MNTLLIITLCYIVVCVSTDSVDSESRIINGDNAIRHQLPYMVSIQTIQGLTNIRHKCGATIISPSWLVSAAHCYQKVNTKLIAVAGLLILKEIHPDNQVIPVVRIINHPEFRSKFYYNDISLLKVKFPFRITEAVQPAMLPGAKSELSGKALVSGWGYISKEPKILPSKFQTLQVDLITNEKCNEILAESPTIDEFYDQLVRNSMMCGMAEVGQSTCHHDSGGPLVQNGTLLGIVQGGHDLCTTTLTTQYPAVFTRVSSFLDFIQRNVLDLPGYYGC